MNKQYPLDEDYIPKDLVTLTEMSTIFEDPEINQLRAVAAKHLKEMFESAEASGILLHARSGYRSYKTQVHLFDRHISDYGETSANQHAAHPGESEHQTGLAMDVTSESVGYDLTQDFGETKEGKWVEENAHHYGFIIRYPKGKEEITGYLYEPWHIRYLGKELATYIYESGLTYEEYLLDRGIEIETDG